jgi:predicted nucleic acid-binding protein
MNEGKAFIDTNVLVYAKLKPAQDEEKHRIAVKFLQEIESDVVISVQVVNEFSSVLLRHKVEDDAIRTTIGELAQDCAISPIFFETVENAWNIKKRYGFSYWDSLIVSSALENQCVKLFTEDLQHNQIIDNRLKIINPFVFEP